MKQPGEENIVVYRPGYLGDSVVSLPAMAVIRERHPRATLVLLTDSHDGFPSTWEVFEATGYFSRALFYEPPRSARSWAELAGLARRLRALHPTRLYYLPGIPRTRTQIWRDALFFRVLCGIGETVGMAAGDGGARRLDGRPRHEGHEPEWQRLLRVVGAPVPAGGVQVTLRIGPAEHSRIDAIWNREGLRSGKPVIAVAPGAKLATKRWPVESYAELARRLLATDRDLQLVIVGGPQDKGIASVIRASLPVRVIDCTGQLTVMESAEVLRRCSMYVGNDSGPMHLAAAMGTPCVILFSARDKPGVWEPFGEGHRILRKDVSCAGCLLAVCEKEGLRCLTTISVEQAFEACVQTLARPPERVNPYRAQAR